MIQRKDWLKTDAGKLYKARTNKNYRQKKQQTKKILRIDFIQICKLIFSIFLRTLTNLIVHAGTAEESEWEYTNREVENIQENKIIDMYTVQYNYIV